MRSGFRRAPVQQPVQRRAVALTLPAPTGGWDISENLANTSPGTAQRLDNYRPTTTGIRQRGGSIKHASIGAAVQSMMSYNAPAGRKLFAASGTSIFDVTTVADADVPPAPDVMGQTSGYYSFVNFSTAGGQFMTVVNGTDPLRLYDVVNGWQQITAVSAPISITGLETSKLAYVWVHKSREFFVEANSLRVRYLPVGSVGGALGTIDLNGIFQRGGIIVFGTTWSLDAGDGLDDKCVIVSSEGEVAIFDGSNPGDANDWQLVGRYDISAPLGPRGHDRFGGDVAIATVDGLVSLSTSIQKDLATLNFAAISRPIAPAWQQAVQDRRTLPWEVMKWPEKQYAVVSTPITTPGQEKISYIVNTVTGRWCRYTGWDTRCLAMHRNQLYFGTNDGKIMIAEAGGNDDGGAIYYTAISNPEHLGQRGAYKTVLQARATYVASTPFIDQLSVSMNYTVELPAPPNSVSDIQSNEWDSGRWDEMIFDGPSSAPSIRAEWVSIGRSGYAMQWQLQTTGAITPQPNVEFVGIDVSFETGGFIV